jgi:Leucine carboxyl methyltransferase
MVATTQTCDIPYVSHTSTPRKEKKESRANNRTNNIKLSELSGTAVFTLFAKAKCGIPFSDRVLFALLSDEHGEGIEIMARTHASFGKNEFALLNSICSVGSRSLVIDRLVANQKTVVFDRPYSASPGQEILYENFNSSRITSLGKVDQVVSIAGGFSSSSLYYPNDYGVAVVETDLKPVIDLKKHILNKLGSSFVSSDTTNTTKTASTRGDCYLDSVKRAKERLENQFNLIPLDAFKKSDYRNIKSVIADSKATVFIIEGLTCYFDSVKIRLMLENIKSVARPQDVILITDLFTSEFMESSEVHDQGGERKKYGLGVHAIPEEDYFLQFEWQGFKVEKVPYGSLVDFKEIIDRVGIYYPGIYEFSNIYKIREYFERSYAWILRMPESVM